MASNLCCRGAESPGSKFPTRPALSLTLFQNLFGQSEKFVFLRAGYDDPRAHCHLKPKILEFKFNATKFRPSLADCNGGFCEQYTQGKNFLDLNGSVRESLQLVRTLPRQDSQSAKVLVIQTMLPLALVLFGHFCTNS